MTYEEALIAYHEDIVRHLRRRLEKGPGTKLIHERLKHHEQKIKELRDI